MQIIDKLITALLEDQELAWVWQSNIAMAIMDGAGVSHRKANDASARVLLALFGVDITQNPEWKMLVKARR